ncbi:hypothetical protein FRC08_000725 [Ceratobasidium sp. 394]|nr:hypothetical protein FRC08_000725 [Ceratobasidium sp. 394]KAG9096855.1 hypothetical protein FS749_007587 [Ceratobasidium sp. UAMH 11750]
MTPSMPSAGCAERIHPRPPSGLEFLGVGPSDLASPTFLGPMLHPSLRRLHSSVHDCSLALKSLGASVEIPMSPLEPSSHALAPIHVPHSSRVDLGLHRTSIAALGLQPPTV